MGGRLTWRWGGRLPAAGKGTRVRANEDCQASVTDIIGVQKLGDERLNPGSISDPLWEHTPSVYVTNILGIVAIAVISVIITSLLLHRLDPRIIRRKARAFPSPRSAPPPRSVDERTADVSARQSV